MDYPLDLFRVTLKRTFVPTDGIETNERLIRRGELILELRFVENYQADLDAMNHVRAHTPQGFILLLIRSCAYLRVRIYVCARARYRMIW